MINDLENWTVWLNLNDVDKELSPHLTDDARRNFKYNESATFSDDEFWRKFKQLLGHKSQH